MTVNIKGGKKLEKRLVNTVKTCQAVEEKGAQNVTLFGDYQGKDLPECKSLQVEKVKA